MHLFMYLLSVTAFVLQEQSWIVAPETVGWDPGGKETRRISMESSGIQILMPALFEWLKKSQYSRAEELSRLQISSAERVPGKIYA